MREQVVNDRDLASEDVSLSTKSHSGFSGNLVEFWPLSSMKKTPLMECEVSTAPNVKHLARRARTLATLAGLSHKLQQQFAQRICESVRTIIDAELTAQVTYWLLRGESRCVVSAQIRQSPSRTAKETVAAGKPDLVNDASAEVNFIDQELPIDFSFPSPLDLALWREILKQKSFEDSLDTLYRRTKERMSLLAEANRRSTTLSIDNHDADNRETLLLLSLVASKTDNAIAILDATGAVEWVNAAFTVMTGLTESQACEQPFEKFLFGPDATTRQIKQFRLALRTGKSLVEEGRHNRADRAECWTTFQLTPLHDEQQRLIRWIAIGTDTTKRHETEAALKTAKLAAEAANRTKTEFLANISHEIRTPMNIIMGMAQLALDDSHSLQQREHLQSLQSSAELLLQILNDVLDLSKIEAAKLEIEQIDFDIADLFRETLVNMTVPAEAKGIELTWNFDSQIPCSVRGDPLRIRQVLINLIGNAIKFTAAGTVRVSVHRTWENRTEMALRFDVQDTGIGIPPDRLDPIFDAFTQADSSTTRQFGGTGLGLTITAELLRLMNGRIWVESTSGVGSTFSFELQLKKQRRPVNTNERLLAEMSNTIWMTTHPAADSLLAPLARSLSCGLLDLSTSPFGKQFSIASPATSGNREWPVYLVECGKPMVDLPRIKAAMVDRSIPIARIVPVVSPDHFYVTRQQWREWGGYQVLVQPVTPCAIRDAISAIDALPSKQSTTTKSLDLNLQSTTVEPIHRRILVVDDHLPNRQLIAHALNRIGHLVSQAGDGRQAIAMLTAEDFDLILMDVQMPELDGFQTTREIRQLKSNHCQNIPIVGVTAYALQGDRQLCLDAGMNEYLTKPIDVHQLVDVVQRLAGRDRSTTDTMLVIEAEPISKTSDRARVADGLRPSAQRRRRFRGTLERLGGDEALFQTQMHFLQDEAPEMLSQLRESTATNRFEAMAIFAHRLSGLLGTFDEQPGAELARRIEALANSKSSRNVNTLLDQLSTKVEKLLAACTEI